MVELADANEGELFSLNSNFTYAGIRRVTTEMDIGKWALNIFARINKMRSIIIPNPPSERPEHFLKQRPALLLDRDGVINRDKSYVCRWEDVEFNPGIEELICAARQEGMVGLRFDQSIGN